MIEGLLKLSTYLSLSFEKTKGHLYIHIMKKQLFQFFLFSFEKKESP